LAIDRVDEAVRLLASVDALVSGGHRAAALEVAQHALDILQSECGDDHPDTANALLTIGRIHQAGETYAEAEAGYLRASEIMRRWIDQPDPMVQRLRIQAEVAVGQIARMLGRLDVAYTTLTRAVADAELQLGHDDPDTGLALNALGITCKYAARFAEGETVYRRAIAIVERTAGANSPAAASVWHNIGGLAFDAGDYAAAELLARRAVQIREAALGSEHPEVAADLLALAPVLDALGRSNEAADLYARAESILERTPNRDYDRAVLHNNLGVAAMERGDADDAKRHYASALAIKERLLGAHHADLGMTLHNLGALAAMQGQPDEAHALLRRALEIFEATLPADHPKIIACRAAFDRANPPCGCDA